MKQFNQLSSEAQTTIIRTLLSLFTGDLPQHVKDEIAEWKIYSTDTCSIQVGSGWDFTVGNQKYLKPQQVTSEPVEDWVPLTDPTHTLRSGIDQFCSEGIAWNYPTDFTGRSIRSLLAEYPSINMQFRCLEKNLPIKHELFAIVDRLIEYTGLRVIANDPKVESVTANYSTPIPRFHLGLLSIKHFLAEYDKLKGNNSASTY